MQRDAPRDLARRVEAARARIQARLPDIDPGDLVTILQSLLRAPGAERRYFLRKIGPDSYVP